MSQTMLCGSIKAKRLVRFYYNDDKEPGVRTVEPHMVARTKTEAMALSGWYVTGASASHSGPGWRTYLLSEISQLVVLDETFAGAREGFKADGGKSFHDVQCAL